MINRYSGSGLPMALTLLPLLILQGCAGSAATYRPIVDGEPSVTYQADLYDCQRLATERGYINGDVKSEAALGSAIGAVVGAAEEGGDGAIAGAILGGVLSGAGRAWETRDERKAIVIQCMENRGHAVVG